MSDTSSPAKRKRGRPPKNSKDKNPKMAKRARIEPSYFISVDEKYDVSFFPEDLRHSLHILLNDLSMSTLKILVDNLNVAQKDAETTDLRQHRVRLIVEATVRDGMEHFFQVMPATCVTDLINAAKEQLPSLENEDNELVQVKNLMHEQTMEKVLSWCKTATLLQICQALGELEPVEEAEYLIDAILEETFLYGAKQTLDACSLEELQKMAGEISEMPKELLSVVKTKKADLIAAILGMEFPHVSEHIVYVKPIPVTSLITSSIPAPSTPKKKRISKAPVSDIINRSPLSPGRRGRGRVPAMVKMPNRTPIAKGITEKQLLDYTQQELITFSRQHKLKYNLTKFKLIDNVLNFVNSKGDILFQSPRGRPPKHLRVAKVKKVAKKLELDNKAKLTEQQADDDDDEDAEGNYEEEEDAINGSDDANEEDQPAEDDEEQPEEEEEDGEVEEEQDAVEQGANRPPQTDDEEQIAAASVLGGFTEDDKPLSPPPPTTTTTTAPMEEEQDITMSDSAPHDDEEVVETPQPVKRGRGRPRKNKNKTSSAK